MKMFLKTSHTVHDEEHIDVNSGGNDFHAASLSERLDEPILCVRLWVRGKFLFCRREFPLWYDSRYPRKKCYRKGFLP